MIGRESLKAKEKEFDTRLDTMEKQFADMAHIIKTYKADNELLITACERYKGLFQESREQYDRLKERFEELREKYNNLREEYETISEKCETVTNLWDNGLDDLVDAIQEVAKHDYATEWFEEEPSWDESSIRDEEEEPLQWANSSSAEEAEEDEDEEESTSTE